MKTVLYIHRKGGNAAEITPAGDCFNLVNEKYFS